MGSVAVKGRLPLADSQDSVESAAQASISSNHFEVPFGKTIGTSVRPICIAPRISPACWSNVADFAAGSFHTKRRVLLEP
jgi:hypothetical protein